VARGFFDGGERRGRFLGVGSSRADAVGAGVAVGAGD